MLRSQRTSFSQICWGKGPFLQKVCFCLNKSEGLKYPPEVRVRHKTCSTICLTPVQAISAQNNLARLAGGRSKYGPEWALLINPMRNFWPRSPLEAPKWVNNPGNGLKSIRGSWGDHQELTSTALECPSIIKDHPVLPCSDPVSFIRLLPTVSHGSQDHFVKTLPVQTFCCLPHQSIGSFLIFLKCCSVLWSDPRDPSASGARNRAQIFPT